MSAAHLEPKAKGGYRLVVDLRLVNTWFDKVPIKFETLSLLRFAPTGLQVGISLDLSDAYHHLRLADSIGHLFTFEVGGVLYQHVGLPMGWLLSPMVFTKFLRPVIAFLRCPSLLHAEFRWLPIYPVLCALGPAFVSMYLDDLLALLSCARDAVALASGLFDLFHRLGITCHRSKSQPDPVSCLKHLGFDVDVPGRRLLLCSRQYEKLASRVANILAEARRRKRVVGKRELARVIGYL